MHLKVKELCYQAWDKENEKQLAQKGLGKKPLVLEEFLFMVSAFYHQIRTLHVYIAP